MENQPIQRLGLTVLDQSVQILWFLIAVLFWGGIVLVCLTTLGLGSAWMRPVSVIALATAFAFSLFTSVVATKQLERERATIIRGYPSAPAGKPEAPTPSPLTDAQKIDALYQLSKRQSRFQFMSNLAWAIFGIIGGYLAGHFLPH